MAKKPDNKVKKMNSELAVPVETAQNNAAVPAPPKNSSINNPTRIFRLVIIFSANS